LSVRRAIAIISDLHLGEGVLDDFDAELEGHLVEFLERLETLPDPTELIVNGDFLDFAQATPWRGADLEATAADGTPLCFTEGQSIAKLTAICQAHPRTMGALRSFLGARDDNRLVVMPGNHDADFFWAGVRARFTEVCAPGALASQISIPLTRVHRPETAPWLWVEHGHQYDPVNAFVVGGEARWSATTPPILPDATGTLRLYECTGTRFLIRFMNGLDARYPLVDNVKPFSRFLTIFGASALRWGRGPLDAVVAVAQMAAYVARTLASRRGDLMHAADDDTPAGAPLAEWFRNASHADREKLRAVLRDSGVRVRGTLDMALEDPAEAEQIMHFLATHLDLVAGVGDGDGTLLGAAPGTLALGASFFGDETSDLREGAKGVIAREGVTTVIMGHTHEPVEDVGGATYFNTGSWTRYYVFETRERTAPWRLLREASYERFPYRLRYAFVEPGATSATLRTWRERTRT
jgi:UDP-2,3-diacylglucosamine pyrophosphatase LpxH